MRRCQCAAQSAKPERAAAKRWSEAAYRNHDVDARVVNAPQQRRVPLHPAAHYVVHRRAAQHRLRAHTRGRTQKRQPRQLQAALCRSGVQGTHEQTKCVDPQAADPPPVVSAPRLSRSGMWVRRVSSARVSHADHRAAPRARVQQLGAARPARAALSGGACAKKTGHGPEADARTLPPA